MSRGNPLHSLARAVVSHAILAGRLTRGACEVCGDAKSQGHHDDYSKPLEVRWLCQTHHSEHHAAAGYAGRASGRPPRAIAASHRRISIRVTEAEFKRWSRYAVGDGLSLGEWLRRTASQVTQDIPKEAS